VAQAGAELGGALGIAVLGSLGTAIYCGAVASAMPQGLSADAAAAARETLGGALSVARGLTDPAAAATLVLAAQHGLTTAVQVTSAIGAVISILTALAVLVHFDAAGEQVCADERRANSCPALSSPGTYQ
jgi:DHA2 family multidrug resistance protein-like MFS transporter